MWLHKCTHAISEQYFQRILKTSLRNESQKKIICFRHTTPEYMHSPSSLYGKSRPIVVVAVAANSAPHNASYRRSAILTATTTAQAAEAAMVNTFWRASFYTAKQRHRKDQQPKKIKLQPAKKANTARSDSPIVRAQSSPKCRMWNVCELKSATNWSSKALASGANTCLFQLNVGVKLSNKSTQLLRAPMRVEGGWVCRWRAVELLEQLELLWALKCCCNTQIKGATNNNFPVINERIEIRRFCAYVCMYACMYEVCEYVDRSWRRYGFRCRRSHAFSIRGMLSLLAHQK